jgi:phosphatidylglycerol:prolipoprotein diacylglycerol transferase
MVAIGILVGLQIFGRELVRSGLPETGSNAAAFGAIGGLAGAKIAWTLENLGTAPATDLLFSRGGLSWFGGLIGGLTVGLLMLRRMRLPLIAALSAAAPALAVGHAIGRVGCFLVGDDYGQPTTLPWGVAFPKGLPPTLDRVHPTQLYECFGLLILMALLIRWRRHGTRDDVVLGRYLLLAGLLRFSIEFIRVDRHVLGPFAVAHIISAGVAIAGLTLLVRARTLARG